MNFSKLFIPLALILVFSVLAGGCQQKSRQQSTSETISDIKPLINADCIVSYFQKDSAPYITQQQHSFNPSPRYLKITATEPTGIYTFTLKNKQFNTVKQPTQVLSALPASFVNEMLATAVFYSFCSGSGMLDTAGWATDAAARIEGKWYTPIRVPTGSGMNITLYRNGDQNRVELVEIADAASQATWLLQSYNMLYSKELDTLVPRRIDVFDIQNGLASKRLMIQFEYKNIRK
jgi:hypothetical protein